MTAMLLTAALVRASCGPPACASPVRAAQLAARTVAWVDYDSDPARKLFETFSPHYSAQAGRLTPPVKLEFVGADVADPARLNVQMRRLIEQRPAAIIATSVNVTKSLLASGTKVPVYFICQTDPVRDGLVPSLIATGSVTGYTYFVPLDIKTLELIHRVFPKRQTVGVIADSVWLNGKNLSPDLFARARSLGLHAQLFVVNDENGLRGLSRDPRARRMEVWYAPYGELAFDHGPLLAATLASLNVPTVYAREKFLKLGGMLSVQAADAHAMDTWAKTVVDILNGAPIGSIPVARPKEIEIAANSAVVAHADQATRDNVAREVNLFE